MVFLYSGSFWSSLYCGVSSLWMGLYRWFVKVSWLGKPVSVFWWVELDFFSPQCNEVSSNELWDVSGFGVTLGSLYIEAQGCVSVLLENLCGMSCSGTCWPLGGAWFQCSCLMSSCRLMFPGVRSSLVFSGLGLKPPASGFQCYFCSSLKTSPSIQHRWQNIYVKDEKFLHSEGHPERFTELHGEEKREERYRGDQDEMRWNQKRRERS